MISTAFTIPYHSRRCVLIISHRYKFYEYLGSDAYGNLFLLPHFKNKRSVRLKRLKPYINNGSKSVNYKGSNISFDQLRKCVYNCEEEIIIDGDIKI